MWGGTEFPYDPQNAIGSWTKGKTGDMGNLQHITLDEGRDMIRPMYTVDRL